MKLDQRSIQRLSEVHPDLQRVVYRAAEITSVDFIITEGLRSVERQKKLVAAGASQTMKSRHITGHAVDLAAFLDLDGDGVADSGEVRWDWPLYAKLAESMKEAARIEGVPIEWGGEWKTLKDGPHFQLPFSKYPGA